MDDAGARILVELKARSRSVVVRFADGEVLEVAPDALPAEMPDVGGTCSAPLVHSLREAAARKTVAQVLFRLLDRRRWTRSRLRRKLLDDGNPPTAVEDVLEDASRQGLLDDRDYAAAFCRECLNAKAVGPLWLVKKLREKGVPAALAADVVAAIVPRERERELAVAAAEKRWRREQACDERARSRVLRFLASRGFSTELAYDAMRRTERSRGA